MAVQAHPVTGEGAQVDVAAAVAPGDVVVDPHPDGPRVVELVDAAGVVTHVVEPGDAVPAAVEPGHTGRAADSQMDLPACQVQILGDLTAGLPRADHQDGPVGKLGRVAVAGGVNLLDVGGQPLGHPGDGRGVVRTSGHDHLVGRELPFAGRQFEDATGAPAQSGDGDAFYQRGLEEGDVLLQVPDDLVADHEAVGVVPLIRVTG